MSELLEVFDLDSNPLGVEEREKFYAEAKKEYASTGKITRKIKSVRVLLMNSEGRMYLQKRSSLKGERGTL